MLPLNATSRKLVKSVFTGEDGHEEKRFTEQQIIGFLKEAEAGVPVKGLCRKHCFRAAASYGWRSKYGGLHVDEAKRLNELEAENAKLKKLLAEAHLDGAPDDLLCGAQMAVLLRETRAPSAA